MWYSTWDFAIDGGLVMASRAVRARDLGSSHGAPLRVGVEQEQWLKVSSDAFSNNILPFGAHLYKHTQTNTHTRNWGLSTNSAILFYSFLHSFSKHNTLFRVRLDSILGTLGMRQEHTSLHTHSHLESLIHLLVFMGGWRCEILTQPLYNHTTLNLLSCLTKIFEQMCNIIDHVSFWLNL